MNNILKRISAYLIDVIFVTLIITLISGTPINPNYKKIETLNEEHKKVYDYYNKVHIDFEEIYTSKGDYTEKLNLFINTYPEYKDSIVDKYSDNKLTEEEKNEFVTQITEDYNKKYSSMFYKMRRLSIYQDIISIILMLLYFVGFAYIMNGETLGKRILKLKIEPNNNKNLSLLNYIIRCLILYGLLLTIIDIICLYTIKESVYMNVYNILYFLSFGTEITIIFTAIINKEHRGIHDMLSNTKVVELNKKLSTTENNIEKSK